MENLGLGGYLDTNSFVEAKLKKLVENEPSFSTLFSLMFSERDNLMYEKSEGYRIKRTTYGQAKDEILRLALPLKEELNLPEGSIVGLYMDNSLLWIELFWCIIICGWRPLLMNLRLSDHILQKALRDCEAKAVVSDGREFSVKTVFAKDIVPSEKLFEPLSFGEELLVMSSGTSENVKICAYSAREIGAQMHSSYEIIKACPAFRENSDGYIKLLTFLPFYHVFGFIAMYVWFAFFSRTFVGLNDMAPQTILNTIKRHGVTHIFAVPLFWETVYDSAIKTIRGRGEKTYKKFLKGMKISRKLAGTKKLGQKFSKVAFKEIRENLFGDSIRILVTGGSSIRKEVVQFFNAVGYHLANGYGMTEIGITSVELSDNKKELNACFVGAPFNCAEYTINDCGELLVRGQSIAKYIIEGGQKHVTDKSEWFNTHDLAECVDGKYRILGRTDELIVGADGENLNPNLFESELSEAAGGPVCVTTDGKTAVLLVCVKRYITFEQYNSLEKRLREKLKEMNLTGRIGKIICISDKLLKSDEFKLNRKRIASDLKEGGFTTVKLRSREDEGREDELQRHLRSIFAAMLQKDIDEVLPDSDFFTDLGGTSLDYMAMIAKLQEDMGVPFHEAKSFSLITVNDFYKFIKEHTK